MCLARWRLPTEEATTTTSPEGGLTPRLRVPTEYLTCVPQEKLSRFFSRSLQVIILIPLLFLKAMLGGGAESQKRGQRLKRPGTTPPTRTSAEI